MGTNPKSGLPDEEEWSMINPSGIGMPSDKGVDWFAEVKRVEVPEWLRWLHSQASLGYANKTTKRQAGFTITDEDCRIVPELEEFHAVLLGYGR